MALRRTLIGVVAVALATTAVGLGLKHSGATTPAGVVSASVAATGAAPVAVRVTDGPGLALPIDCTPGRDCAVQNHVDRDAGPGARDYRCGTRTYQDHNGTDFRLPDQAVADRGVNVLAAASGTVLRTRDGVPDQSVRFRGLESVAGTECGNGVVIDHGDGLSTQYCHLAATSIAVQPGQTVTRGTVLGRVGLSGQTEYPHLHFTVRRDGAVVDPFQPDPGPDCATSDGGPGGTDTTAARPSLWASAAAALMPYRTREVLNAGFTASPVTMAAIEAGTLAPARTDGPVLIAWVRAIGLRAGDVEEMEVTGPDGRIWSQARGETLPGDRAQQMLFSGRRLRDAGWPGGRYTARYRVLAGGEVVLEHRIALSL